MLQNVTLRQRPMQGRLPGVPAGRIEPETLLARIIDRGLRADVSNALTDVSTRTADAGYLYGLAVGLMIAGKGGAR